MLTAGLDGIEKKLTPPPNVNNLDVYHFSSEELQARNIATLPGTLEEALQELEKDALIRDARRRAYSAYVRVKNDEWDQYRMRVSQWELDQYLEMA